MLDALGFAFQGSAGPLTFTGGGGGDDALRTASLLQLHEE